MIVTKKTYRKYHDEICAALTAYENPGEFNLTQDEAADGLYSVLVEIDRELESALHI